jgi:Bacterial transcriptional activator domain
LAEAEGAPPEVAAGRLREALALWRGSPLADLSGEPFAAAAIARPEELRLVAVEERIAADAALGRHAHERLDARPWLERTMRERARLL